jgi:PAS domain S-box-containing protein
MVETTAGFYQAIVESSRDVITIIDPSGKILYQNPAIRKILDLNEEEMKGNNLMDFLHPDDAQPFRRLLTLSGRWKESPFSTILRFRHRNGTWVKLESRGLEMLDHPVVGGMVISSREHQEARADTEHRIDDVRLKVIAESTYHAIVAIDEFDTIVFTNRATEKLFGHTAEELRGKPLDLLIPDHLRAYHHNGMKRYLETGKRHTDWTGREVYALHKSGREFPVQVSYQEYQEEGKRYFVGIIEDITVRKNTEQRLMTQYAVTRVLAGSWNINETIPRMLKAIGMGLGFDAAELWLAKDGDLELSGDWQFTLSDTYQMAPTGEAQRCPSDQGLFGKVWSSGRAQWVNNLAGEALFLRVRRPGKTTFKGGVITPIRFHERIVGIMVLFSLKLQSQDPEQIQFLEILGGQIGDLLERKRGEEERARLLVREQAARAAAQESEQRLSFQADASLILSSSLDYYGSLSQIARLVVPRIADWCAVDIIDDNRTLQRITLVHRDPSKAEAARQLRLQYPPSHQSRRGASYAVRTGKSELIQEVTDDLLRQFAQDPNHYSALKTFGFRSVLIVPLRVRGQSLGAITFVTGESGRTFGIADLAFAEDLARRAAIAVDNARLYKKTQDSLNELKANADVIAKLNAELEQRVQQRTSQLEEANRELEAFSYSVSHDLRAPVRSIHSFAQILGEDHSKGLSTEGRRLLGIVQASAERMGRLIDDLLRFSRTGRQSMQQTTVDMKQIAEDVFLELTRHETTRNIQFTVGPLPPALGDPSMIRQVLTNLLSNALKFSPRDSTAVISVTGEEHENFNGYSVRDNGVGFKMEYAHKLFGVFQRLHSDHEFPGTGVGLALVQRIIHRHGGTISAHSDPGKQTIFTFTLQKGETR